MSRPKKQRVKRKHKKSEYLLLLMALPFVLHLIIFYYAQLFGWAYAFVRYIPGKHIWEQEFTGLLYFKRLFQAGSRLTVAFRNTLIYGVLGILTSVLPVIFAIFLSEIRNSKVRRLIQTMSSFPNFISWILVYSLCFMLFSSEGQIIEFLVRIGVLKNASNLLANADVAYLFQMLLGVWKGLGWSAIIYMAAISGIDPELYDAANVDGAGRFRRMIHITVPAVMPTYFVMLVMSVANIANAGFDQYYMFYNPMVSEQLEVIPTYVYRIGIGNGEISLATAAGISQSLISIVLLFTVNKLAKKVTGSSVI